MFQRSKGASVATYILINPWNIEVHWLTPTVWFPDVRGPNGKAAWYDDILYINAQLVSVYDPQTRGLRLTHSLGRNLIVTPTLT